MIDPNNRKIFKITFGPKGTPFTINNGVVPGSWADTTGDDGRSEDVLEGKKVHTNIDGEGVRIVGSMPNNGLLVGSIDGISEEVYYLPAGYISGGKVYLTDDIRSFLASISGENFPSISSQPNAIMQSTNDIGETVEWLGGSAPDPVVLLAIPDALRWMLRFETEDDDVLILENGDVLCREQIQGGY